MPIICQACDEFGTPSPEWLAKKGTYIGSGDIATILGLNPYKTPLKLWAEMTGKVQPVEENDAMWLGRRLEEVVVDFYQKKNPEAKQQKNLYLWGHDSFEMLMATPDYWIWEGEAQGVHEIKTAHFRKGNEWKEDEKKAPLAYQCQGHWQCGITKTKFFRLTCLVGGRELPSLRFNFDPSIFDMMVEKALAFWDCVKDKTPPPALADDAETLTEIFGKKEEVRDLPTDFLTLFAEYDDANEKFEVHEKLAEEFKEKREGVKNRIRQLGEGAKIVTCADRKASFSFVEGREVSYYRKPYVTGRVK